MRSLINRIVLAALLTATASTARAQPRELDVKSSWLFAADAVHPGGVLHAALQVSVPGNFHVQSNKPLDESLIPTLLTLKPPDGIAVRQIVYPKPVRFEVVGFEEPLEVFDPEFIIGVALEVQGVVKPGLLQVTGELQYQACNDKVCLAPATLELKAQLKVVDPQTPIAKTNDQTFAAIIFSDSPPPVATLPQPATTTNPVIAATPDCDVLTELEGFTVLGAAGGYLGTKDFIAFVDQSETGTIKRNVLEDKGPLAIVLLVIVGGILLNLTPCVLPLIPINLAIIGAGAQAGSRARGFALGGTYGLAMAAVYGVLGLIVTLTATSFGRINATIWFNAAIAILFVFLALAMFDWIAIDFTKYQSKIDATKVAGRGTFALAFFMGAVSAVLAGACVAPVVIQVVVYASDQYARGSTIALALPFFLGLGMALPWPFAGAGLSLLPKPGMWMVRVKQAMGVFILAFAGYYAYLAYGIWRIERLAGQGTPTVQLEGGWTADICAGLAQARAEDKPVVIDMWATWCKNCLAMDKTTFKDPQVQTRLQNYVKIKFQAQQLHESPNREMLERFKQIGLPAYAILRPGAKLPPANKPSLRGHRTAFLCEFGAF